LPTLDEILDLHSRHGVAFDRGRVVDVVDPDRAEYLIGFNGTGKAAQAFVKQAYFLIHLLQHFAEGGTASPTFFPTIGSHLNRNVAKSSYLREEKTLCGTRPGQLISMRYPRHAVTISIATPTCVLMSSAKIAVNDFDEEKSPDESGLSG